MIEAGLKQPPANWCEVPRLSDDEGRFTHRAEDLPERFQRPKAPPRSTRRTASSAFRHDENGCRAAFHASVGNAAIIDRAGKIIGANSQWLQFARQHGGEFRKVSVGANYLKVCQTAIRQRNRDAFVALNGIMGVLDGSIPEFCLEYSCPGNPEEVWYEMIVHPLRRPAGGAVIIHLNISDRRAAELRALSLAQDLAQINRLAVLGELTATFAHEVSQPLAAIRTNTETMKSILLHQASANLALKQVLSDIIADNLRAGKLIQRLRMMLKRGPPRFEALEVNALIRNVSAVLHGVARSRKVEVSLQLESSLPLVWGEQLQLQQVFLNLVINAFEAMRRTKVQNRKVSVCTRSAQDGQVEILVRDQGTGIPAGDFQRVFAPFYTTKPKGLGMGLAICRSIVETHKGAISVANNARRGVTFRVVLPAHKPKSYDWRPANNLRRR